MIGEIDLQDRRSAWRIGGIPAVLVAAFLVKEMPLEMLRWLVIVVVLYAAAVMVALGDQGPAGASCRGRDGSRRRLSHSAPWQSPEPPAIRPANRFGGVRGGIASCQSGTVTKLSVLKGEHGHAGTVRTGLRHHSHR